MKIAFDSNQCTSIPFRITGMLLDIDQVAFTKQYSIGVRQLPQSNSTQIFKATLNLDHGERQQ